MTSPNGEKFVAFVRHHESHCGPTTAMLLFDGDVFTAHCSACQAFFVLGALRPQDGCEDAYRELTEMATRIPGRGDRT